jgi:glycosyltransferase involved in cell wall biosynthesis
MRILHFISYPSRMAGANRSLFELVSSYPETVRPVVVTTADGPVADTYRRRGIPVTVMPVGARLSEKGGAALRWPAPKLAAALCLDLAPLWTRLARLVKSEGIDIVHVNDARGALLAGPVARMLDRPLVAHMRGERSFGGPPWWLFEHLPHRIVTVSQSIQDGLTAVGRRKAVAIYNGTGDLLARGGPSVPFLDHLRARGVVVVGAFASTVPFKGCHHLMDAVALLNERGWRKKLALVWVGDLPAEHRGYQDWLDEKLQALELDNFTLTGWQADPFPFYRSVDVTVLPSVSEERLRMGDRTVEVYGAEGLPRTHLEAMCHGRPVVGTRIAGVAEVVADGETGLLVPPSDPAALADAIERLISDRALRERMGAAGRQRVLSKFSTETYVDRMVSLYRELRPS